MAEVEVSFTVNGDPLTVQVASNLSLLAFLREKLGLTGARNGCSEGTCGACTVLVDGHPERSCRSQMKDMDGKSITTIEALSADGKPHPLQEAFARHGAPQCGFCTPAMILTAKALLDENPSPTREQMKRAFSPVMCRCGSYPAIFRAVQEASEVMAGVGVSGPALPEGGVGVSVQKRDAMPKALGTLKYGDDLTLEGMLHGKVVWSAHPHAEILNVDTTAAEKMPGVRAVLTAKDIRGDNVYGPIVRDAQVIAANRVRFIGEPVVVVFADTKEQAETARDICEVSYLPLEGVFDPEEALKPDAPRIHPEGNVHHEVQVRRGNVDLGFAQADIIVEGTYTTPFVEHAYLEPEVGMAEPTADGGVTVMMDTQDPFSAQRQIADALAIDCSRVRVMQLPSGGSFGAKSAVTLQILLAMGALYTGRPVKMVLDRSESLRVHMKKHAVTMLYKTGAMRNGKLVALEAKLLLDTGAYASYGRSVTNKAAIYSTGPYDIPHVRVDATAVHTNNIPCGAMRGFGINQVTFAMESQVDKLAEKLGLDPFTIRRVNAMRPGSSTSTGQILGPSVGLLETLDVVENGVAELPPVEANGRKIGIGVACCFKNVGLGLGAEDVGRATAHLLPNGKVLIRVAACEIGQGFTTVIAQIAAETLGLSLGAVEISHGDTRDALDTGPVVASRTTFMAGNAVIRACQRLKETLLDYVSEEYEVPYQSLSLADGRFVHTDHSTELISLAGLAQLAERRKQRFASEAQYAASTKPYTVGEASDATKGEDFVNDITFGFGTQAARVAVDEYTGAVEVLDVVACYDVGRAINPRNVRLQIEGGVIMGMGYALSEEFKMEGGWNVTNTLGKCGVPRATQTPNIISSVIEKHDPDGPFGAKGLGEAVSLPTAPAIINAIRDATGVRIYELPAKRSRVLAALRKAKTPQS